MNAPEKRNPAPRANAGNRADRESLTGIVGSTNPPSPTDPATFFFATRYRLPMPVAALVARLGELAGALS